MSKTFPIVILLLLCIIKVVPSNNIPTSKPPYEEYFIEHEVSGKEANAAFVQLTDEFFNGPKPAYCGDCTHKIMRYCQSNHLIQDHCCCDQRHGKEELPWVPHSCYTGEAPCKSHLGSCFKYHEHRECCCDKALANKLRRSTASNHFTMCPSLMFLPFTYILLIII